MDAADLEEFSCPGRFVSLLHTFPEGPPKVSRVPRIISSLIRSRQTPKLRLTDVRKVIRGRSKPIIQVFMESH